MRKEGDPRNEKVVTIPSRTVLITQVRLAEVILLRNEITGSRLLLEQCLSEILDDLIIGASVEKGVHIAYVQKVLRICPRLVPLSYNRVIVK
jgi:hypothetical protein